MQEEKNQKGVAHIGLVHIKAFLNSSHENVLFFSQLKLQTRVVFSKNIIAWLKMTIEINKTKLSRSTLMIVI